MRLKIFHLYRGEMALKTLIWNLKVLTFIDGEPLRAGVIAGFHCKIIEKCVTVNYAVHNKCTLVFSCVHAIL